MTLLCAGFSVLCVTQVALGQVAVPIATQSPILGLTVFFSCGLGTVIGV